jgi:Na+-driven multidrug efflux pump
LKIDKTQLIAIIRIGIPSGLGSVVFSASNVMLQSSVNSFDNAAIIAGRTAASDINVLIYQIQSGFLAACISFSGQCYGARDYKRIDKVATTATMLCIGIMGVFIAVCTIFAPEVIRLFNTEPEVVSYGATILKINCLGLIAYIPAENYLGCSRGMKRGMAPTILNIIAICLPRLIWILAVFPAHRRVDILYLCYPISWGCSTLVQVVYYYVIRKKLDRQLQIAN